MNGRYEITERIATGGMAEIYRGKALGADGFEKIVVIKRILPEYTQDPDFVAMFVHEAKLATQLDHPNIVQVFDLGKVGDEYFITMEYIDGPNLHASAVRCFKMGYRPFPLRECLYIISEVCKGLEYAHQKASPDGRPLGIIHRDVSPPNVLMSFDGTVKLGDFGVAKARDQTVRTRTGVLKGKFGYMSPEQAKGDPIDHRSDVFSLGVVLWELLAAKRLFKGASPLQTVERVARCEVPPLATYNPEIPDAVEEIVGRALSADRDTRYQGAGDLSDAISNYLFDAGMKVSARDVSGLLRHVFLDERTEDGEPVWHPSAIPPPRRAPSAASTSVANLSTPAMPAAGRVRPVEPSPAIAAAPLAGAPVISADDDAEAARTEILNMEPSYSDMSAPEQTAKYKGGTLLQFHPVHLAQPVEEAIPTLRDREASWSSAVSRAAPSRRPSHEGATDPDLVPTRMERSSPGGAPTFPASQPIKESSDPAKPRAATARSPQAQKPAGGSKAKASLAWLWWTLGALLMGGTLAALIYFSRQTT